LLGGTSSFPVESRSRHPAQAARPVPQSPFGRITTVDGHINRVRSRPTVVVSEKTHKSIVDGECPRASRRRDGCPARILRSFGEPIVQRLWAVEYRSLASAALSGSPAPGRPISAAKTANKETSLLPLPLFDPRCVKGCVKRLAQSRGALDAWATNSPSRPSPDDNLCPCRVEP